MERFDLQRSQALSVQVDGQLGKCIMNTNKALALVPGAAQVYGWLVLPNGTKMLHYWLELDGVVVDPTPVWRQGNEYNKLGRCGRTVSNGR